MTADEKLPGENTIPDPLHADFTHLRDIYFSNDPDYTGRFTVPVLFDKKTNLIVSNEVRSTIPPKKERQRKKRAKSKNPLRAPKSSACSTTNSTTSSQPNTSPSTYSRKTYGHKSTNPTIGSTTT